MIILYVVLRVDTRFYVPDGAKRAGDYSGRNVEKDEKVVSGEENLPRRILSEGEVFDDVPEEDSSKAAAALKDEESRI